MTETCTCGRIAIGLELSDARNWSPDCAEHGVESDWYRSPEQIAKRKRDSERLRDLQRQASEARRRAVQDERARQVWASGAGCAHWSSCGGP